MLRAIVIPEKLPEYLVWLEKGNKQNDPYKVAEDFEVQLSKSLKQIYATSPNIVTNIHKGIQILLSSLLSSEVSPKAVNRLLTLDNGLWKNFVRQFIKDLDHDLNLMHQFASGEKNLPFRIADTSWQTNWKELKICWQKKNFTQLNKYQPLAEVFSNLDNAKKISAIFYHVSYRQVPKKIFAQLSSNDCDTEIYGVEVQREVTVMESLWLKIIKLGDKIVPVSIVIPIVLVSLLLGFGFRGSIAKNTSKVETNIQVAQNDKLDKPDDNRNNSGTTEEYFSSINNQNNIENPIDVQNIEAIINISNELSSASPIKHKTEKIQSKIFDLLKTKDAFKIAIKNYEINKTAKNDLTQAEADGIIDNKTKKILKCEVAKSLGMLLIKNACK